MAKKNVETLGTHILLELEECKFEILNDHRIVEDTLLEAARRSKATIIESRFHRFNPFGISGVVVIAESHLTIHTWPEHAYAAVDIFTCGNILQPGKATDYLIKTFESKRPSVVKLKRGRPLSRAGTPREAIVSNGGPIEHVFG